MSRRGTVKTKEFTPPSPFTKLISKGIGFQHQPRSVAIPVQHAFGHAFDQSSNRLYIAGGMNNGHPQDKLYEFQLDPSLSSPPRIVSCRDLPHRRTSPSWGLTGCSCLIVGRREEDKRVLIIGGSFGLDRRRDVHSFHIAAKRWENVGFLNVARENAASLVTADGRVLVTGGAGEGGLGLTSCEEYDVRGEQWYLLPFEMTKPRWGHCSFSFQSRIVVVGGSGDGGDSEVLDLGSTQPRWIPILSRLKLRRRYHVGIVVKGHAVVAGGIGGNNRIRSLEAIKLDDLVDAQSQRSWKLLHGLEMRRNRAYFGMAQVENHLVALSGLGGDRSVESLDLSIVLNEPDPFFSKLFEKDEWLVMDQRLEELTSLMEDIHQVKMCYTLFRFCIRIRLVTTKKGTNLLRGMVTVATKLCCSNHAFEVYEAIVEKAKDDRVISLKESVLLINRAQAQKRRCRSTSTLDLRSFLARSTRFIARLDHRNAEQVREDVSKLQDNLLNVKASLSTLRQSENASGIQVKSVMIYRLHVETAISFITCVINSITLGVSPTQSEAFDEMLCKVVDFGDSTHIRGVLFSQMGEYTEGMREQTITKVDVSKPSHIREALAFSLHHPRQSFQERHVDETATALFAFRDAFDFGQGVALERRKQAMAHVIYENNAVVVLSVLACVASLHYEDMAAGVAQQVATTDKNVLAGDSTKRSEPKRERQPRTDNKDVANVVSKDQTAHTAVSEHYRDTERADVATTVSMGQNRRTRAAVSDRFTKREREEVPRSVPERQSRRNVSDRDKRKETTDVSSSVPPRRHRRPDQPVIDDRDTRREKIESSIPSRQSRRSQAAAGSDGTTNRKEAPSSIPPRQKQRDRERADVPSSAPPSRRNARAAAVSDHDGGAERTQGPHGATRSRQSLRHAHASPVPSGRDTRIPDAFSDAMLDETDEEACPMHAAVKFSDMETLHELIRGQGQDHQQSPSLRINKLDSKGRTALDLAALTGQREMMSLLHKHGGRCHFKNAARMKHVAKARSKKLQQYLDYVESIE